MQRILLEAGTTIDRLNRPIRRSLVALRDVCRDSNVWAVISSTFGGTHSPGSLHYSNDAYDFYVVPPNQTVLALIAGRLKDALGSKGYDVIFEDNHTHIEYDPK